MSPSFPGKTSPIFNCGEMESGKKSATASYRPCGRGGATTILYAWTARATPLTLPADVAFRVGGDSGVDWLVLQVHYASVSYVPERGDDTAVVVAMSRAPRPKRAGVLLMATGGYIPPKVKKEGYCAKGNFITYIAVPGHCCCCV